MKSIVKKAREIVTQLYERNMVAWNDLDREVVFAIQALIAEVQRMEALAQPEQEPVALQYPQKDIDWQREQQIKAQASIPPQRTWVDPPEGWKYGFPAIYDPEKDGQMSDWIISKGYPIQIIKEYGEQWMVRCWPVEVKPSDEF